VLNCLFLQRLHMQPRTITAKASSDVVFGIFPLRLMPLTFPLVSATPPPVPWLLPPHALCCQVRLQCRGFNPPGVLLMLLLLARSWLQGLVALHHGCFCAGGIVDLQWVQGSMKLCRS